MYTSHVLHLGIRSSSKPRNRDNFLSEATRASSHTPFLSPPSAHAPTSSSLDSSAVDWMTSPASDPLRRSSSALYYSYYPPPPPPPVMYRSYPTSPAYPYIESSQDTTPAGETRLHQVGMQYCTHNT